MHSNINSIVVFFFLHILVLYVYSIVFLLVRNNPPSVIDNDNEKWKNLNTYIPLWNLIYSILGKNSDNHRSARTKEDPKYYISHR